MPTVLAAEVRLISSDGTPVAIGPVQEGERRSLFDIFADVVERGDGYPHEPPLTPEVFDSVWDGPRTNVVAARARGDGSSTSLLGAYYLRPNFPGKAAHIANAGYVVARSARGRGIGRLLVEDSIRRAPLAGFDAIQFNLVFASNPARTMYEALGWEAVGRIPRAVEGDDAIVYWRSVG